MIRQYYVMEKKLLRHGFFGLQRTSFSEALKKMVLVFCLLGSLSVFSQIKKQGIPPIRNYSKDQYKAEMQNWSIVQDERGILYFANNAGVLQFDGNNWNLLPMPNFSIVRSLAIDSAGTIYAGAFGTFGYLDYETNGKLRYVNLADKLPESKRNFSEVWKIYPTRQGVFFHTMHAVFRYYEGNVEIVEEELNPYFAFFLDKALYVNYAKGLKKYRAQQMLQISGSENFIEDQSIWSMSRYRKDTILIGTKSKGLYLMVRDSIFKWHTPVDALLRNAQIYCGIALNDNHFAFGTIQDGLVIIDKQGKLIQHINMDKGLRNNTVLSVCKDHSGNLWLGLDNGIAYIEIQTPFSFYNEGLNIHGAGYASVRFNDKIYMGTNQGLFYKKWKTDKDDPFRLIENTKGQVWSLTIIDGKLLCGHHEGAFEIRDTTAIQICKKNTGVWNFFQTKQTSPGQLLAGTYNGLVLFEKNREGNWQFKRTIAGFIESSREVVSAPDGTIWISHVYKGVFRVLINNELSRVTEYQLYGKKHGLPSDYNNSVFKLFGKVGVSTQRGIYRYEGEKNRFVFDIKFNDLFKDRAAYRPKMDSSGSIWYFNNGRIERLKQQIDGSYQFDKLSFKRFENEFIQHFEYLNFINNKNVIIGTEKGFIHYSPQLQFTDSTVFYSIIRKVSAVYQTDTVLYYGNSRQHNDLPLRNAIPPKPQIVQFVFSSPCYKDPGKMQYRYKLDGIDANWSLWSNETVKEYTHLPAGNYTFRVKARNISGLESNTAVYKFRVKPPWYKTVWSYIIYLVLLGLLTIGAIRYLFHYFDLEKQKLEKKQRLELKRKEEEFERENLRKEKQLMLLQNEKLHAEIQRQKTESELKGKELASVTIQIVHKNEILTKIMEQIERISDKVKPSARLELTKLYRSINQEIKLDEDWERFKMHFDKVHTDFFKRLRKKHPKLTSKDLKLCAYLRMNLNTKEIAPLLSISVRGVETRRYRLRNKLELPAEVDLVEFMMGV